MTRKLDSFFSILYAPTFVILVGCGMWKPHDTDEAAIGAPPPPSAAVAQPACAESDHATCAQLESDIAKADTARTTALAAHDSYTVNTLTLQINHKRELLDLYQSHSCSAQKLSELDGKYKRLQQLLDEANKPGAGKLNAGSSFPLAYGKEELAADTKAMKDFGELYLDPKNQATLDQTFTTAMPWSGYWYPLTDETLYSGDDSPLKKLDAASAQTSQQSSAAEWQKSFHDKVFADTWEGMCGAWAMASIRYPEPKAPIVFKNVTFSIKDQKALLTKAHENFPFEVYGSRYLGDASTDGTFQNMRPEVFHRLVQVVMGDRKEPLITNDFAGIEVWNKPIYRVRWTITPDKTVAHAYAVTAWPWMVRQRDNESDQLTTAADRSAPVYTYRLYVDPTPAADGRLHVIAGEWTGQSFDQHPHTAMLPLASGQLASANPEFNKDVDILTSLFGSPNTFAGAPGAPVVH